MHNNLFYCGFVYSLLKLHRFILALVVLPWKWIISVLSILSYIFTLEGTICFLCVNRKIIWCCGPGGQTVQNNSPQFPLCTCFPPITCHLSPATLSKTWHCDMNTYVTYSMQSQNHRTCNISPCYLFHVTRALNILLESKSPPSSAAKTPDCSFKNLVTARDPLESLAWALEKELPDPHAAEV